MKRTLKATDQVAVRMFPRFLFDLTPAMVRVVCRLHLDGPQKLLGLCDAVGLSSSALYKETGSLIDAGLVERKLAPRETPKRGRAGNGRTPHLYSLTDAGRALMEGMIDAE